MKRILDRIVQTIRGSDTLCIVGHIRPDGDCIGSQLGLAYALKNAGKKITVWNEDPMPRKLAFLDPDRLLDTPKQGKKFDCAIATDCASYERLGTAGDWIKDRQTLINIDHHPSNSRYGDLNWISDDVPSSGELI